MSVGVTTRKHSRGRSVTSKTEMLTRHNAAKPRIDCVSQQSDTEHVDASTCANTLSTAAGSSNSNTSKPVSSLAVSAGVSSPTQHKSPTVAGTYGPAVKRDPGNKNSHQPPPVRPHSSYIVRGNMDVSSWTMASASNVSAVSPGGSTHCSSSSPSTINTSSTTMADSTTPTVIAIDNDCTINQAGVATTTPMTFSLSSSQLETTSPLRTESPLTSLGFGNTITTQVNVATAPTPSVLPPVDVCASPTSAILTDAKPPREIKEKSKLKESHSVSLVGSAASAEKEKEREVGIRKGSEPPPSLQAIFSRDIGRRWSNRQFSVDDMNSNMHPKQHSLDSSYLSMIPQSPKYRRVKSPSMSDKNTGSTTPTRMEPSNISIISTTASLIGTSTPVPVSSTSMVTLGEEVWEKGRGDANNTHHTPSIPHLISINGSPQVTCLTASLNSALDASQPIVRAQSTQQLKMLEDKDVSMKLQHPKATRSKSGSNMELVSVSSERERPGTPSGLKSLKDRELSQSKDSLDISKDPLLESGMKKAGSRESLKGKETSKVILSEHSSVMSSLPSVWTPRDKNKENWERSVSLRETQSSAKRSMENVQASFPQVSEVRIV